MCPRPRCRSVTAPAAEIEGRLGIDGVVRERWVGGVESVRGVGVAVVAVVGRPLGALGVRGGGERGAAARVGEHRARQERRGAEAVVEVRVGDDHHEREPGHGADGGGQLAALPGVTPGVDDERALTTEDQARGEVQLAMPAGQHAVADLDPPPLGRVGHRRPPAGPGGGDPGTFLTGPSRSIGRAACPV